MDVFKNLFRDSNYVNNPQGTWQKARNLLLSKKFNSPVNVNGTKFSHLITEGYSIGEIETNNEIVYFVKVIDNSNYNSKICVYNIIDETLEDKIKGNFNFNRPIEGIYKYDYQGSLVIAWCDGVFDNSNSPKICKITNIDLPLSNGFLEDSKLDLIELFPKVTKGTIEVNPIKGIIEGVYAYVTFCYCYNEERTVFKDLNSYTLLTRKKDNSDGLISNGLEIILSNLQYDIYDSIILGIHIIGEESSNSYTSEKIPITNSSKTIQVTSLQDFDTTSNESLLIPNERFNKIETITEHKETIIAANVKKDEPFKFQKYANLLKIRPLRKTNAIVSQGNLQKVMLFNEVYNMYVQAELKNGTVTDWFHIPNTDYETGETNGYWNSAFIDKYKLDENRFDSGLDLKQFHLENKGTENKFGLWQNKETYPNDDEYNSTVDYDGSFLGGKDLRNKPVSMHRVMEQPRNEAMEDNSGYRGVHIMGATITNFNVIPSSVRNQIENIRVGFEKRDLGNSLVVADGVAVPVTKDPYPGVYGANESKLSIEQVRSTPFNSERRNINQRNDGYSFNRLLFLSPELEKFKPRIDFNLTVLKGIDFRYQYDAPIDYDDRNQPLNIVNIFNYNKFFYNYYSYDYKLPNNSAQGVPFLDGGLYINYFEDREVSYLENGDNLYPHIPIEELNDNGNTQDKNIALQYDSKFAVASVSLLNLKDNLYNLTTKSINASFNTINVKNTNVNDFDFLIGDVTEAFVRGGLKYLDSMSADAVYGNYPLKERLYTPIANSELKILGNREPYPEYNIDDGDVEILNELSYGFEVEASENYARLNDLAQYNAFNYKDKYISKFLYRIIRSNTASNEAFIINSLRRFSINNYYEGINNKGDIVAVRANDEFLFIQYRYELYFTKVKDVLSTENGDTYLADGNIFDRDPQPLTMDKKGYIGSEHKFACIMSKEGYITIDHNKGNIIIAKPAVEVISNVSIRNFLEEYLKFHGEGFYEEVDGLKKAIDNPYLYTGFAIGVDNKYNMIYFTKLYPQSVRNVDSKSRFFKAFLNRNDSNSNNILLDSKRSFTLAYSLDTKNWLFDYDFKPSRYITINNELYLTKTANYKSNSYNMTAVHLLYEGNKGEFFGIKYKSYIDIIFNAEKKKNKEYLALEILTDVIRDVESTIDSKTVDSIVIYNDYQCSGEVNLDTSVLDVIRNREGNWRVNNFRDVVLNPNSPIVMKDGSLNKDNLDFSKNWFDKSYFISKFLIIRIIWNNDSNDDVYLNAINLSAKISKS